MRRTREEEANFRRCWVDGRVRAASYANMLGVRREGVTEAAGKLQSAGLIHYSRGRITVIDRSRLEARACECYQVVKTEFDRLLPYTS